MSLRKKGNVLFFVIFVIWTSYVIAEDITVPGEVKILFPTITNSAVEWKIRGDDNLNGKVTVRYREVGSKTWHDGMPLMRVPASESPRATCWKWENKHSGSIFNLRPDTEYEIVLKLTDPDGGEAEQPVKAKTRPVPCAPSNAPVRNVTPNDTSSAKPGEVLLLGSGDYGVLTPFTDGKPGAPIVYRSVDGSAVFRHISLANRKYIYLEGLTLKGDSQGINLHGAEECVVRRCKVFARYGIVANSSPGMGNCYIAENIVEGLITWGKEALSKEARAATTPGESIQFTGPGNVICFNRVTSFWDCISHMEGYPNVYDQTCNDIYNNDIYTGTDDAIEADYSFGNCRIMRNRITNSHTGLSSQPGLGGPTYFIRNVIYNLSYASFKLHNYSYGDVVLHNTVVKVGDGMRCCASVPFDYAFFRNNLCIGGTPGKVEWPYGPGSGQSVMMATVGPHCSFDYDALGTYELLFKGNIGTQRFSSLEELHRGPHEAHGIQVDMSIFDNVSFPESAGSEYKPQDLRPRFGTAVVDAGVLISNINDDFLGKAPDMGAYESGQELPVYGPRPEGKDDEISYINIEPAKKKLK